MPKRLEKALERAARRKGFRPGTDRYKRYVYGTLAKAKKEKKHATQSG